MPDSGSESQVTLHDGALQLRPYQDSGQASRKFQYNMMEAMSVRGARRLRFMDSRGQTPQRRLPKKPDHDGFDASNSTFRGSKFVTKDLDWRPAEASIEPAAIELNPSFCPACRRLLAGRGRTSIDLFDVDTNGAFFEHLDEFFLEKSAQLGCPLCVIVWNAHRPAAEQFVQGEHLPTTYDYGSFFGDYKQAERPFAVRFRPARLLERRGSVKSLILPLVTVTLDPVTPKAEFFMAAPTRSISEDGKLLYGNEASSNNTGSPKSVSKIKQWTGRCKCQQSTRSQLSKAGSRFVPDRLIDVGGLEAVGIRIVSGTTVPDDSEYITLSHCWGKPGSSPSFKLLQSNFDSLSRGVRLSDLPKTFSEACLVTRELGLRYLWIDSLCIIQDSKEDWSRHAAVMWEVYTNAYLTLAATASRHSGEGLFRKRLPRTVSPCIVDVPDTHGQFDAGRYVCYHDDEWTALVDYAPLNHRAWVYQERLLSPRIVHFSETQLSWECHEFRASERFAFGIPPRYSHMNHRDLLEQVVQGRVSVTSQSCWHTLISTYTSMSLTYESDKMVALSAVARRLSSIPGMGRYLAGLWDSNLIGQLCWEATARTTRPTAYRAPSWSWMSLNGKISPSFSDNPSTEHSYSKAIIQILEAEVTHDGNPFMSVSDGFLRLLGPLFRITRIGSKDKPKRDAKSLSLHRSNIVQMMSESIPGYTGENLKYIGVSDGPLPTGAQGDQHIGLDIENGIMVMPDHEGDHVPSSSDMPESPKRNFEMDFGGKLILDEDFEAEELENMNPVFMPVFCTMDTTLGEIEALKGLVLAESTSEGETAYRRLGVGELNEYTTAEFFCELGNQEIATADSFSFGGARLKLEDIVPDDWAGKELDFVPKDFACHEVIII